MKKIIIISVILVLSLNYISYAQTIKEEKQLQTYIYNFLKRYIELNKDEKLKINIKNINNIILPINTADIFNPGNISKNGGNCTFLIKKEKIKPIYVEYKILKRAIISTIDIKTKQLIDTNYIKIDYVEKFKIPNRYINPEDLNNIINNKAKFFIKKGTILTYTMIEKPYDIKMNSIVNLIIKKDNLFIQTTAKALRNGYKGEYIKVITHFNKVLEGKIVDINTVEVNIK